MDASGALSRTITIGSRVISDDGPCYVIAEIGHNHGGDVTTARKLIQMAAEAGVDAVKFQVRTLDKLYTQAELDRPYDNPHSYGATYGEHRRHLELSKGELVCLQQEAGMAGIDFLATPFDLWAADLLMNMSVPAFKIASGDLGNRALLAHVAEFGVPMILSTGGATLHDISMAMRPFYGVAIVLLHCTSVYPAAPAQLNLRAIEKLRKHYPLRVIGYSGHDTGILAPMLAQTLGARIIEKHVTLDRAGKGTDHAMSLEPQGLRKLVEDLEKARQAMGDGIKRPIPEEAAALAKFGTRQEVAT